MEKKKTLKVNIPPGVNSENRLRIKGSGHQSPRNSAKPGDLYLFVKVESHPLFVRKGNDIHSTIPITLSQAILGDVIKVSTISGEVKLRVRPGTQHGSTYKIYALGVKNDPENKLLGNHIIHWDLKIPVALPAEQIQLLSQFGEEETIISDSPSIFQTIKSVIKRQWKREI